MQAWLETASGVRLALGGVCSIGRSSKNTLVMENPEVSRRHALIQPQAGEYWLVDLGSSNGVRLNEARVHQPVRLNDQDRIEIGGTPFVFRVLAREAEPLDSAGTTLTTLKDTRTAALWLLLADVEGSTRLCRSLPVEEFAQVIGRWFLFGKETVERCGGTIKDYTGDGFFAYWPRPDAAPASIAQAVTELKVRQTTVPPPFRLAIHYGTVTVDRQVGSAGESLLGPEVNFLFRMEKLAAALRQRCLLSEPAAHHLRAFAEVAPAGAHPLAGFEGNYNFFGYHPAPTFPAGPG